MILGVLDKLNKQSTLFLNMRLKKRHHNTKEFTGTKQAVNGMFNCHQREKKRRVEDTSKMNWMQQRQ